MMHDPFQDQAPDRIEVEASDWVVRLAEGTLSPEQERALAQWRAEDPEHERRFQALQRTWGEIPALTGLAALVPAASGASVPVQRAAPARTRRRIFGGLALATAAAAAAAVFVMPAMRPATDARYATALAQSRQIALPDGSVVTLGARSAIAVAFTATERRVVLRRGEAFFDVVHNPDRPFLVEAGASLVRDIGTRFDVKLGDGAMHVSVQEGQVEVSRAARDAMRGPAAAMLRAGQRAEILQPGSGDPGGAETANARIVALPSQGAGAWREGRLVYDNGRLADLIADVNRYYAPGVRLASPDAGELRITASFRTNEIPAFMSALSATLPVQAEAGPDGVFAISASRR